MPIIKSDKKLILKISEHTPHKPYRYTSETFSKGVLLNPDHFTNNSYSVALDEMEISLESSSIDFVNYLPIQKALIVGFYSLGCYVYQNVSEEEFLLLLTAQSKGSFFHKHLKAHEYKKIPEDFSVSDVKSYLENFDINVFKPAKTKTGLINEYSVCTKIEDKKKIIENPNFPVDDFISEIKRNYWLCLSALKNPNISHNYSMELENLTNQEYKSIPKLFKRKIKSKK